MQMCILFDSTSNVYRQLLVHSAHINLTDFHCKIPLSACLPVILSVCPKNYQIQIIKLEKDINEYICS